MKYYRAERNVKDVLSKCGSAKVNNLTTDQEIKFQNNFIHRIAYIFSYNLFIFCQKHLGCDSVRQGLSRVSSWISFLDNHCCTNCRTKHCANHVRYLCALNVGTF